MPDMARIKAKFADEDGTKWDSKAEFLMAVLGAAVGLGNLWRFPYQCYGNGGGAFLVPFFIMTILVGFPQVTADFAFAQYCGKGALACWGGVPIMSGLGWSIMGMSYALNTYYTVVVAYGVFYMFASFTKSLPWGSCDNWWNTPDCLDTGGILQWKNCLSEGGSWLNSTCFNVENSTDSAVYGDNATLSMAANYTSPSDEYFHRYLLQLSPGIETVGAVRWPIMLSLLFCLLLCFAMLIMGTRSWGKVSYVTTLLPYLVLTALLTQSLTMEGSGRGLLFLLTPRWEKLHSLTVWGDAAVQAYFSLGSSGGFNITIGSHNKFKNNCIKDSIILAVADTLTSLFCAVVVFSTIGAMAAELGVEVDQVVGQGAGLAFVVYSDMIERMPGAPIWSVIFNFTLVSLGIGSVAASIDLMQVNATDSFPRLISARWRKVCLLIVLLIFWFLGGLIYTTQGGMYVLQMMDSNVTFVLLFLGLTKGVAMSWIYGVGRLSENIHEMCGETIPLTLQYIYKFLTPTIIIVVLGMRFAGLQPLRYGAYIYPAWCTWLSAGLAVSFILIVPAVALFKVIFTNKDIPLKQRLTLLSKPIPGWGAREKEEYRESPESYPLKPSHTAPA